MLGDHQVFFRIVDPENTSWSSRFFYNCRSIKHLTVARHFLGLLIQKMPSSTAKHFLPFFIYKTPSGHRCFLPFFIYKMPSGHRCFLPFFIYKTPSGHMCFLPFPIQKMLGGQAFSIISDPKNAWLPLGVFNDYRSIEPLAIAKHLKKKLTQEMPSGCQAFSTIFDIKNTWWLVNIFFNW